MIFSEKGQIWKVGGSCLTLGFRFEPFYGFFYPPDAGGSIRGMVFAHFWLSLICRVV
jgi:hypothetical protein